MTAISLDSLDLAALLCSKVCHDVISPVSAIVNGLELYEMDRDPETRDEAFKMVRKSATKASSKLQFCRLAFGAAGSAGASIDTGDAEKVARGLLEDERTQLEWNAPRLLLPKNKVKLVLNMCLIAAACVPRGGKIAVTIDGGEHNTSLKLIASGLKVILAGTVPDLLRGAPAEGTVDSNGIQAYYTGLVARTCGMDIVLDANSEMVTITSAPVSAGASAPAAA
ncbi:MAG: histidine phosphotransferase [Alphaproteobacteria bacterium]|nr:histidine phosphotransferase [Alphaproteobacteria bacterium]